MEYTFVEDWLETLKAAWINADMDVIKNLFAKTTQYYETPFYKPATNITEILKLWNGVEKQVIKRLDFSILAVEGNTAVINWIFEREGANFNGIYLIKFNNNKECLFFKSWEMNRH